MAGWRLSHKAGLTGLSLMLRMPPMQGQSLSSDHPALSPVEAESWLPGRAVGEGENPSHGRVRGPQAKTHLK